MVRDKNHELLAIGNKPILEEDSEIASGLGSDPCVYARNQGSDPFRHAALFGFLPIQTLTFLIQCIIFQGMELLHPMKTDILVQLEK